jgi:hypothetical protein
MYLLPLSSGYSFPDDSVSPKEKSEVKFGSNVGRALYSRFCMGGTYGWGYSDLQNIRLIRDYGDGVQDERIYREWHTNGSPIGGGNARNINQSTGNNQASRHARLSATQMRSAMVNISYKPFSPIPKFSSTVISMLSGNDYFVEFTSTQRNAIDEKTREKLRVFYASTMANPLAKELGLPEIPIPFQPKDERELEMLERQGAFKADIERALEQVAETGFKLSNWPYDVRRKCNKDAIDFNLRCAKLYTEPSGAVKWRYVDVTKMVVLWNDTDNEPVAIGDLRMVEIQYIYKDLLDSGYTEDEIKAIGKTYQSQQIQAWSNDAAIFERKDPLTNRWMWLDFKVPILEFEYLSTDYHQFVKGVDKSGKKFYNKNEKPVSDKEKDKAREYDDYKCNYWYEGSYIIGTDKVFNWRKKPNQVQGSKLNPCSSYVFDRASDNGQSLTQRAIPLEDDLMFAVIKKRAAVAASAPKGYVVDVGDSGRIMIGNSEYSVFDLIHMHRQNGIVLKKTTMNAATGKQTSTPIVELENGLGKQGDEWLREIASGVFNIASAFGITDATAAQMENSGEKAVGVWEGEIQSTNHAIYPLKVSEMSFKEKLAARYALQVRVNIKYDDRCREFYENQLGKHVIGVLDSIDHICLDEIGVVAKALPNEKKKDQILMRAVEMSKIATRDGSTYLTPADVERVSQFLENDDIEGARQYMYDRERFNRENAERVAQESMQMTIKGQQDSVAVSEDEKRKTLAKELRIYKEKLKAEKDKEIEVMQFKYDLENRNKITEIREKGSEDMNQLLVEIEGEKQTGTNIRNDKT